MPPRKRKKPAEEMTTDEVLEHVFHPDVADALRDATAEDESEETDEEPLT